MVTWKGKEGISDRFRYSDDDAHEKLIFVKVAAQIAAIQVAGIAAKAGREPQKAQDGGFAGESSVRNQISHAVDFLRLHNSILLLFSHCTSIGDLH